MKRVALLFVFAFLFVSAAAFADSTTVTVNAVNDKGVGQSIGTVTATDSDVGLILNVNLKGLTPGAHGFHVHAMGSCGTMGANNTTGPAMAAGGHFDPDGTNTHKGPIGNGHKGDLPYIVADDGGMVKGIYLAPRLTVADIKGKALMVHAGGDNYSDNPALGGGGARVACGVVK